MKQVKSYCCSYYHDGATWAVTITAYDWNDAQSRVKKLGNLRLDGELIAEFPDKLGLMVRFLCWLRNTVKRVSYAMRDTISSNVQT
jgi:hypothetical protein